jgi:hypothetical protein
MPHAILTSLAVASGVVAHHGLFRHGEWDVASPSIFSFYSTVFGAAALLSYTQLISVPLLLVAEIAIFHAAGLFTSMLVYRALFHRLKEYPGPLLARLTIFYITALSMKKLHLFEEVQKLHAQYGDYVRLGEPPSTQLA